VISICGMFWPRSATTIRLLCSEHSSNSCYSIPIMKLYIVNETQFMDFRQLSNWLLPHTAHWRNIPNCITCMLFAYSQRSVTVHDTILYHFNHINRSWRNKVFRLEIHFLIQKQDCSEYKKTPEKVSIKYDQQQRFYHWMILFHGF